MPIEWPEGIADLEEFLKSKGLYFQCRGPVPHSGGEIRWQYGNDKIAVCVSADRGYVWGVQVSDVAGWAEQWWSVDELGEFLSGNSSDRGDSVSEQMRMVREDWDAIVNAFTPQRRSGTHTALKEIRASRAKRMLGSQ